MGNSKAIYNKYVYLTKARILFDDSCIKSYVYIHKIYFTWGCIRNS